MKKRIIGIVAVIMLVAVITACLVACNPYKQNSIGGGDKDAQVESNGGYVVKQGNYLYYINGYDSASESNAWGVPVKQSLVRAELDENGNVKEGTSKIVVPKVIASGTTDGGFAIFGEWIYYATYNYDKDKNGTESTTDMDFMRTKIDGSVTQLIATISSRSARYIFTSTRVLYYLNNTISYVDFSGMSGNKSSNNGKGTKDGVLAESVASLAWAYGIDEVFYSKTITGNDSYKHYNELCSIKLDGTSARTLATQTTFLGENDDPIENLTKVYQYTVQSLYKESDGTVTLYYTKSYTANSTTNQVGLYCVNIGASTEDIVSGDKAEKQLNGTGGSSVTLFPLGYTDGAIVSNSNGNFWQNGSTPAQDGVKVTGSSQTIWYVSGDYVYYSASSATALNKIKYKEPGVAEIVLSEGIYTSFLKLDFIGSNLYFFSSDDDYYLHTIDVLTFDKDAVDEDGEIIGSQYIGLPRDEED